MIISLGTFFYFFKILIFWVVWMVKGQKMAQNDKKKLTFPLYISGTIHHMILIYGVHVQKDNISRYFLHFFQILIFWVNSEVKEQKMA